MKLYLFFVLIFTPRLYYNFTFINWEYDFHFPSHYYIPCYPRPTKTKQNRIKEKGSLVTVMTLFFLYRDFMV